jgi:hypothetical protein
MHEPELPLGRARGKGKLEQCRDACQAFSRLASPTSSLRYVPPEAQGAPLCVGQKRACEKGSKP